MKKVTLLSDVTFYPDRIEPFKVTIPKGEWLYLLETQGNAGLLSLSQEPTAGDSRWIPCESFTK
jgi:hypothetical protein